MELAPTAGTMPNALAECCTPGARTMAANHETDDVWKWRREKAGRGQEGCIGDDCNASRTCPPPEPAGARPGHHCGAPIPTALPGTTG